MRNGERGFTYLVLLFVLALGGVALAALGEQWVTLMQREREAELLFRGREIAAALAAWRDSAPAGQPSAPEDLQQLLTDTRTKPTRHHLRRLYTDPFTLQADWLLLRDEQGRITALASRSQRPALARPRLPLRARARGSQPTVGDWLFEPPQAASTEPAPLPAPPVVRSPPALALRRP
jgi:type II secretory pathway pseudopilin PulG